MAKITLEPGDTCEVEDNEKSGWDPESIDELIVTLVKDHSGYWDVICESTGKTGLIHESYLHLKT